MQSLENQTRNNYVIRVLNSPGEVNAQEWNGLLSLQPDASPFMKHQYLAAMDKSGSASPATGWTPRYITLWQHASPQTSTEVLVGACAVYIKDHSYGEYVFDWAWANAYQQHGLDYYPKAVVAPPFTPVPGSRLMAHDAPARNALLQAVMDFCKQQGLSSLHLLFIQDQDQVACTQAGLMLRHTVQFHWKNVVPTPATNGAPRLAEAFSSGEAFKSFDHFLGSLSQDKRKKIRQERRKVADAGVTFRSSVGTDISVYDWNFFYRCYEQTYLEHGNAPYLTRDFFVQMAQTMPDNWLLFVAERDAQPIASSLIAINDHPTGASGIFDLKSDVRVAYGRYWGAMERVDCLHFEACYYQPLQWCITHGFHRFEGGAQGEHKMARALLPVRTTSAHWLAHPAFASAVERFLEREKSGIDGYLESLSQRSPLRAALDPQLFAPPQTMKQADLPDT